MYSDAFCKVYNEFGWNYFPEAFGAQLLTWIERKNLKVNESMDLACGPGVLCEVLHAAGIKSSGMDFSEGMIKIAKERNSEIFYEVADMITYRPDKKFELVTCTGDALNHITDLENVAKIFENVYAYTADGGYFIFDILDESEAVGMESIPFTWDETVSGEFMITESEAGMIHLTTRVFENGKLAFTEQIEEIVHDRFLICDLLRRAGFVVERLDNRLLDDLPARGMKWFIVAKKQ